MNLTIDMMRSLKEVGFAFEEFEHSCNPGMVFFYNHSEYVIGGKCDGSPCSEFDKIVALEGTWLPDESQLMLWLQWKESYDLLIKYIDEDMYFYGEATNKAGEKICGSGPDLLCCFYKLIFKICRAKFNNNI